MSLHVDPTAVTPGEPVTIRVTVTNDSDRRAAFALRTVGLDEAWVSPAVVTEELEPGTSTDVPIIVTLPPGFPASEHLVGIRADPLGGGVPPSHADLLLTVGDGSEVLARLEPHDVHGRDRGRFDLVLRNRGDRAATLALSGHAPQGRVRVRLEPTEITVAAGRTARVRGRLRGRRPIASRSRRLPFVVTARGRSTPLHVEGSFTQRPMLSGGFTRVLAIVVLLAVWVAAMGVGLTQLTDDEPDADTQTELAGNGGGEDGDGDGGAEGGGGGGSTGGDGEGGGGDEDEGGEVAAGPPQVKVGGTVDAEEPGGVTVRIEPVSLVDEDAQGATLGGGVRPRLRMTKLNGRQAGDNPIVPDARSTVTDETGQWAFASVRAPGFYLLTFSKAGYSTRSYVVSAGEEGEAVELDAILEAGDGALSGIVVSEDGPVPGVDITVSDGTVEFSTRTPTSGDGVGTWSIEGLSTPGTFLVTASRRGFGTETLLVELDGGGEATGLRIPMRGGVGSISGTVTGTSGSDATGIGGATVTVTDGTITRTATTLTEGPVGSFNLPQLPVPGSYTLTVEAEGFSTATQLLELTGDLDVPVDLEATTTVIFGTVTDELALGLPGVGVTLANEQLTFRTTTVGTPTPGRYNLEGVPAGTYVLSFERFGFVTQSHTVEIDSIEPRQIDVQVADEDPVEVTSTGEVTGTLFDRVTGVRIATDGVVTFQGEDGPVQFDIIDGGYLATQLPPGVIRLEIAPEGYEPVVEVLRLGIGAAVTLRSELVPLASVTGRITAAVPAGTVPADFEVRVTNVPGATPDYDELAVVNPSGSVPGTYEILGDLRAGDYTVTASAPDHVTQTRQFSVEAGETEHLDVVLPRLGRVNVSVTTPGTNGTLAPASGVTITIAGPSFQTPQSVAASSFEFTGLASGTYTISYSGAGFEAASPVTRNVAPNTTAVVAVSLFRTRGDVGGSVQWVDDTSRPGVGGATVAVNGVFAYTQPLDGSVPQPIFQDRTVPNVTTSGGAFVIPAAFVPLNLRGTITITHANFDELVLVNRSLASANLGTFLMEPKPGVVDGDVSFDPADTDFSTTTARVTVAPPGVALSTLVAGVNAAGELSVRDPAESDGATDRVRAGTYQVLVSRPGYVSQTATVHVEPNGVGTVQPSVTLPKLTQITATAVAHDEGATTATATTVQGATFTLRNAGGATVATLTDGAQGDTLDGSVVFADLVAGTYTVLARAPGHMPLESSTEDPAPVLQPVSVVLSPGQTAAPSIPLVRLGRITGSLAGVTVGVSSPLAGVTVIATGPDAGCTTFSAVTGADGSFTITGPAGSASTAATGYGLRAGRWVVSVQSVPTGFELPLVRGSGADPTGEACNTPSGRPTTPAVTVPAGGTGAIGTLELQAQAAVVSGVTRDGNNAVLGGVSIIAVSGSSQVTATSDAATGAYSLDLDARPWTITFSKQNFSPVIQLFNLGRGDTVDYDPKLPARPNFVIGNVLAVFGNKPAKAIAGVTVTAHAVTNPTGPAIGTTGTTAAVTGAYTVGGLPDGDYIIRFVKEGFPTTERQVSVSEGATRRVDLTLTARTRRVEVTVTSAVDGPDPGNQPDPLANVVVKLVADDGTDDTGQDAQATTNASGVAVFTDAVPGGYDILVEADDLVPAHVETTDTEFGGVPLNNGTSAVTRAIEIQEGRISGTVTVDSGSGPAGTTDVLVSLSGSGTASTNTSSSGAYEFFVAPGTYTIDFEVDSDPTAHTTARTTGVVVAAGTNFTGATAKNAALVKLASVSGHVSVDEGTGAADATGFEIGIDRTSASGTPDTTTTTDEDGDYSVLLLPGTYTFSFEVDADHSTHTFSVTLSAGQVVVNRNAALVKLGSISGTVSVESATGATPGTSGVTVSVSGPTNTSTVTVANGLYTLPGLLPGTYTISVTPPDGDHSAPATQSETLTVGEAATGKNFTVPIRRGTIVVTVVDHNGAPVNDASVTIDGNTDATRTTGTAGVYTFENVLPGTYAVTATRGALSDTTNPDPTLLAGGTLNVGLELPEP